PRADPEGALAAAHAADVGQQRDLGHRDRGRHRLDRRGRAVLERAGVRRHRPGVDQRLRRLPGHRPHARHVQERQEGGLSVESAFQLAYIAAAVLFIIGLKMLGRADTARRGNTVSAAGMLVAVVATLLHSGIDYALVAAGLVVGGAVGVFWSRRVQMTQMPETVALFNGAGGGASLLVGWAEYLGNPAQDPVTAVATVLAILVGGVTLTGSVVAWSKLSERVSGRPILFTGQQVVNGELLLAAVVTGVLYALNPEGGYAFLSVAIVLSLVLGVLAVLPIGGADMPIVISLLNSYSGVAASAAGFVIDNTVLIVAGSLVGASGLILTQIMCKAMNRSLANVLFSGFVAVTKSAAQAVEGEVKPMSPQDAYYVLEAAGSVVFVPGY